MFLKSITPYQFRNLASEKISFSPEFNFFISPNGQGKTNVLEMIFLMCTLKSFRGAQKKDFLALGCREGGLKATVQLDDVEKDIELQFGEGNASKRQLRVNGHPVEDLAVYFQDVKAVCYSPEDLGLLDGESKRRRQFIDRLVFQIYPSHLFLVSEYNRILKHRNTLLKNISKGFSTGSDLDVWTEKLLDVSARLTQYRLLILGKLNAMLPTFYSDILKYEFEEGILSGKMTCHFQTRSGFSGQGVTLDESFYKEIYSTLEQVFHKQANAEKRRGQSLFGSHLDDFVLSYGDLEAYRFASMGQKKTLLLSLRLAELELVLRERSRIPLLLLDDLTGELDVQRIVALAELLTQKWLGQPLQPQVFITSVQNPSQHGKYLENARFFAVNQGHVLPSNLCGENVDKGHAVGLSH